MTVRSKDDLMAYITGVLPDNNAGMISAADVRNSIVDTVDSITNIIRNHDFQVEPFLKNVSIKNGPSGILEVGSGVRFSDGKTQYTAFEGIGSLQHNQLAGKDIGDPHIQYVPISGTRVFTNNVGFDRNWINSSGSSSILTSTGKGLSFTSVSLTRENVNVGSGTSFYFQNDKSTLSSARGAARAWINFDGSGTAPVVRDSYNISGIQKLSDGHFKIIFHSGVFKDNNYVAIGTSNAMVGANSAEDFTNNTVGIVTREGNDGTSLRSLVYVIRDEGNRYINAKINDLVVYGTEMLGSGQPPVTILT